MSLVRFIIFSYLIFIKPCSYYSNTDANQHCDVAERVFCVCVCVSAGTRVPATAFQCSSVTLITSNSQASGTFVDHICLIGAHHPGKQRYTGLAGSPCAIQHFTELEITQSTRKHLTRPHVNLRSTDKQAHQILENTEILKLVLLSYQCNDKLLYLKSAIVSYHF